MEKKMFWGLGFLIVIFIAFMIYMHFDYVKFKDQMDGFGAFRKSLQQDEEVEVDPEKETPQVVGFSSNKEKPQDEPGFEWVRHGDHWDKIPVAQTVVSDEPSNKPLFLEGDDVDITDKDYYIYHVYDKRYAIKRVNLTPEDMAKVQEKLVELDKKAEEVSPGYAEALNLYTQAVELSQKIYAKGQKSFEINRQKDELNAALKSGEISWEEWSRQIKEIDESPDAIEIKQYMQSLEEVDNEND